MYKLKSEIIEQIQYFHKQVYELYLSLYEKSEDPEVKILLADLSRQEKRRDEYLEKHKNRAKIMNTWLMYPPNKISNHISECFKNIDTRSNLSVDDVAKIELYFDNCLIKLYETLSSEEETNGNITNIFHYIIKKTKQEDSKLQERSINSKEE